MIFIDSLGIFILAQKFALVVPEVKKFKYGSVSVVTTYQHILLDPSSESSEDSSHFEKFNWKRVVH